MQLVEVYGNHGNLYAILSHTWGDEELLFEDLQHPALAACSWNDDPKTLSRLPPAASACFEKKGFNKVQKAVELARKEGFGFIWIDTCCIDKSSSAELSEAINSMFQWYKEAVICLAYLADVKPPDEENPFQEGSTFRQSRWFMRGWTLQELIAPRQVKFFAQDWSKLGAKIPPTKFTYLIAERAHSWAYSIASRMRWAAGRQTTRVEDIAYCLLGIFDVNMPLLYGEGKKAFIRLQEQILLQGEDQSVFAWYMDKSEETPPDALFGLLADCPDRFLASGRSELVTPTTIGGNPSAVTSRGIQVELFLVPCHDNETADFQAVLSCTKVGLESRTAPAIFLKRHWGMGDQYSRVLPEREAYVQRTRSLGDMGSWERVFVNQRPAPNAGIVRIAPSKDDTHLRLENLVAFSVNWKITETHHVQTWNHGAGSSGVEVSKFKIGVPIAVFGIKAVFEDYDLYMYVAVGLRLSAQRSCESWCQIIPKSHAAEVISVLDGKQKMPPNDSFAQALSTDGVGNGTPIHVAVCENHRTHGLDISLHVVRAEEAGKGFRLTSKVLGGLQALKSALKTQRLDGDSQMFQKTDSDSEDLMMMLEIQKLKLQLIFRRLLFGIYSKDEVEAMISDPSGTQWQALDMATSIRQRLSYAYSIFERKIHDINAALERLKDELRMQESYQVSLTTINRA
ncbi:heterokaryon incompatibility protein-domain-containing protein [Triangularia verruculosa]|uniref:Heterokaryon incompatibility protein-domain-containing protein n=1 Tax=Triangularia verruculosa TaxID=2587418 RepID=A0AAN6XF00_9PEZI|nr:heterokaryon incompatibility protein-domain-containing protein [Triangularia verruculosa]